MIGRQQQLLRIDFETAPSHEVLAEKLADFDRLLDETDVVVLSDYGKGGLAHIATMIERAKAAGKPVLVDPKGDDWTRYRGATMITPNRSEFREVVGRWRDEREMAAKAKALLGDARRRRAARHAIGGGDEPLHRDSDEHIPAVAREVFDVSGAGDTVIATLGVLLGAGAPLPAAVRIANQAAGVVVGKLGTAVVTPEELG